MKSIVVKGYLRSSIKSSENEEIRRFNMDVNGVPSYGILKEKIFQVFPNLPQQIMDLHWQDSEGDFISFNTDAELQEAIHHSNNTQNSVLKVYIQKTSTNSSHRGPQANEPHPGVMCDGCDSGIVGNRFKCVECPDYDLCCDCERKNIHNEHTMMRIVKPIQLPAWMQGIFSPPSYDQAAEHPDTSEQAGNGEQTNEEKNTEHHNTEEGASSSGNHQSSTNTHPLATFLQGIGQVLHDVFDPAGTPSDSKDDSQKPQCQWPNKDLETLFKSMQEQYQKDLGTKQNSNQTDTKCSTGGDTCCEGASGGGACGVSDRRETPCPGCDADCLMPSSDCQKCGGETGGCQERTNPVDPSGTLYPSLSEAEKASNKTAEALTHMKAMGFNDDGGWLTSLIQAKDGDINKVLDILKPVRK